MKNFSKIVDFTKTIRLLYVEDNDSVRSSTVEMFNELFLEVILAVNGEDGLEKFYAHDIDIIISDIKMPKLSGFEMLDRIRDVDKEIPILLVSAHSETDYFKKGIQLDVNGYLLKPLQIDELVDAIYKISKDLEFQKEFNNNLLFLKQYQELTDIGSAVSKTDSDGIITYVNDEFVNVSGYKRDELIGNTHNLVRHPENDASIYIDLWHTVKHEKKPWKGVLKNRSKKGNTYYSDVVIKPILDKDNNIVEYISTKINVTGVMSQKQQLYDFVESSHEPLLAFIKIEGFSDIENFYGHTIAQRINDSFAKYLNKYMPRNLHFEKLFSIGEGEFVFVQDLGAEFKNKTQDEEKNYIQNLIDELQNFQYIINELNIDVGEIDYDMSIIMSIAYGEECLENVKYGMKVLRRNKQEFIVANGLSKKEQHKAEKNLNILKMVKKAIDNSNIVSYFQPIVCNKTKEILKYESLVRLIDEDEKVISPYLFLDIAKKGKYYAQITSIVLENSFIALEKTDKSISINISVLDIEKSTTRDKIFEFLQMHKNSSNRVIFELLEDADVRNFDEIVEFISNVKEYGVKIAIDDFGSGYSNFARLLEYQPDILKIDGSLIKNIESDNYSLSVVKTIVSFAKEQNIEMVAEYVENENIYNILTELGVQYSQGYYFGVPAPMQ